MKSKAIIFGIISIFFSTVLFSQYSIQLTDGTKIETSKYKFDEQNQMFLYKNKRDKTRVLYCQEVFSVIEENGNEEVFYRCREEGIDPTLEQFRDYLQGHYDARDNYKAKGAMFTGFALGAATVYAVPTIGLSTLYAPALPTAGNIISGSIKIKAKNLNISPEYANNQCYIDGYLEMAKRKKITRTLFGTSIGISVGIASAIILFK